MSLFQGPHPFVGKTMGSRKLLFFGNMLKIAHTLRAGQKMGGTDGCLPRGDGPTRNAAAPPRRQSSPEQSQAGSRTAVPPVLFLLCCPLIAPLRHKAIRSESRSQGRAFATAVGMGSG